MRFSLVVLKLGVESLDHRWLDPMGTYELPFGQAAPVMKPVLGGTEYETVGVIEFLVKEENTVYALGEVFSDLDVYKALIDGEKVLSVETFPFETAVVRGTLRIQRLTVRGALVIDKAGWAWK
jgi:hypothetical protein